jgi:hypothetical protein
VKTRDSLQVGFEEIAIDLLQVQHALSGNLDSADRCGLWRIVTGRNDWGVRGRRETGEGVQPDRRRYGSGAVDVLLRVERRKHYRLVMNLGGVLVDGGGGLGAEVAVAGVEVESADVVGAVIAGEPHAALDACDCV